MPLRTYLLFLALLSLLGLCTVHEAMRETRTRYRMAEALGEEERLRHDLMQLKAEVAALTHPAHLELVLREADPSLVPLLPVPELEEVADRSRPGTGR